MQASFRGETRVGKTYLLNGKVYSHEALRVGIERALGQANIGRNSPCTCDSGRKYKHCCRPAVYDNNTNLKELMVKMKLVSKPVETEVGVAC